MQKYRFVQYLIIWIGILLFTQVYSQSADQLATLYKEHRIDEIYEMLRHNRISDPDWADFFRTLFVADSDSAIIKMVGLFSETDDRQLKTLIRDRISQFYYARGYYETAQKVLTDDSFFRRILDIQITETHYGIQIGAFSTHENAENAKNKFEKSIPDISIIKKVVDSKDLYVVIAGRYDSRQEAESALKLYKSNYKINGYIVQY